MENKLQKKYGLLTATSMVVGIVIGSGIFFKASKVIKSNNGSMGLSLLTVFTVGVVMLVCAYVFSMLAGRVEKVNGLVDYAEATCGSGFAYAVGWFSANIYYPCLCCALSWISATYTTVLFGIDDKSNLQMVLAALFLILSFFVNIISPRIAGKFQVSITVIKMIPLGVMAIIGTIVGLVSGQTVDTFTGNHVIIPGGESSGFMGAVVAFAFAFEGWIIATSINAEIKDSKKILPKALIIGILITIGAYAGYYLGLGSVLSPEEIMAADGELPIVAFTALFGGHKVFGTIAYVLVIISCLGTLNGIMLGASRSFYSVAARGQGPSYKIFSQVDAETNMPHNSTVYILFITMLWLAQWEFGFVEHLLPQWLCFENDELPIITLYGFYIPIFIVFMIKAKDLNVWKRFVLIPLAIGTCIFMVYSAVSAYGIQSLYYLCVFAIVMAIGMLFYRINGKTIFTLTKEKLRIGTTRTETEQEEN